MVLNEETAQARLDALHRERDLIDRAITDLTLYLELGRRLAATPAEHGGVRSEAVHGSSADRDLASAQSSVTRAGIAGQPSSDAGDAEGRWRGTLDDLVARSRATIAPDRATADVSRRPSREAHDSTLNHGPNGADWGDRAGLTSFPEPSEGQIARRRGRVLLEAAMTALEEARRPLHAREIAEILTARGILIPGRDPVAALNTRLWKRTMRGGALRRLGDAVYAISNQEKS